MEFNVEVKPTSSAHHIVVSKARVAVVDNHTNITFLDPEDLSKNLKLEQEFNSEVTYKLTRGNSSSSDGRLLCLYLDTKKRTYLCVFDEASNNYKPRVNLEWNLGQTEVSIFSKDNSLLLVGGADGHMCVYSTSNGKLVNSLPKMMEYITSVAISGDNNLVAYTSFKKKLVIFDMSKNLPLKVTSYSEIISVVGFLNQTKFLIYGARDNAIILFDILNGRTVRELGYTINWPVFMHIDENDQYALISDKAGYVHIIDLTSTEAELEPFYNSPAIVVEIKPLKDEFLYFLFDDGSVKVINILEARRHVLDDAAGGSIAEVYKAISQNPILRFGVEEVLRKTDEAYEKRLDLAMHEIAKNNLDTAMKMMGKTLQSPSNKEKFEAMLQHKDKVIGFWQQITSGNYASAYEMAKNSDFYRKLPFYDKMEKRYSQAFSQAQHILLTSKNLKEAQEELLAFSKVPSKQKGIKAMFANPDKFSMAEKKFKERKFEHVNKLIVQFPELKQAPFYHEYKNLMDGVLSNFVTAMSQGMYSKAIADKEIIEKHFPDVVEKLGDDFEKLNIVSKFSNAVKEKKFGVAMDLAAENTFLIAADDYKILDKMVGSRIDLALKNAFARRFAEMDKILRPFLKSKYSRSRAVGIYKIFYLAQIDELGKKMNQKHWKHTLNSYVLRFGTDPEIEQLVKRYDQDNVYKAFEDSENGNFLKYKAVPNIVTGKIIEANLKAASKK
ncbi:MAG: hypothetical protein OIF32_00515 [Campylobacterales bacterium]|nr:hypothetical protein [Campylobacterales bacterium]